jgi:hypothetical protein
LLSLVVDGQELAVGQVLRACLADFQIGGRRVRWPVHVHGHGEHGLSADAHQRHEVQC